MISSYIAYMHSLGWPQIHYVAEASLELLILLPVPTGTVGMHHHTRSQMQLSNCLVFYNTLKIGLTKNALKRAWGEG